MSNGTATALDTEPGGTWTGFDIGDGYEFVGTLDELAGWQPISSWGLDGWDMGSWPLMVVGSYDAPDGSRFATIGRCEGDLTVKMYASRDEREAALDAIAAYHWRINENGPGADVPEEHRRGRFSWARLDAVARTLLTELAAEVQS